MDIWDFAAERMKKENEKQNHQESKTIVFVGSLKSGKSSLIYRFLNREENPRPTLALDYTFGRQTKTNDVKKNVCHIWEIGGGTLFADLLEFPINLKVISELSIALVVDLSTPSELLLTLNVLLEKLRKNIENCFAQNKNAKEKLMKRFWKTAGNEHPDKSAINPFFVPLLIIGGKYDVFQNFEPEQRKIICRTLRIIAHTNGAGILFFSSKMESLVNRMKAVLSNMAFESSILPPTILDHSKPLFIPFGTDSLAQIGGEKNLSLAMWKNAYETHFPQLSKSFILPDDPAKDANFREPAIDDLRHQKDDELESYKKVVMKSS